MSRTSFLLPEALAAYYAGVAVREAPLFAELSGFRREELRLAINALVQNQQVAQLQFRLGGTGHV